MTRDRSTERCQRLTRAPSATAKRRNAPVHQQRNMTDKRGAAAMYRGASQTFNLHNGLGEPLS